MAKEIKKVEAEVEVTESAARTEFKKIIELYKKQNPVKYAKKEAELLAKLAKIN
jgi:hypothetical protein